MIIPRVKEYKEEEGHFRIGRAVVCRCCNETQSFAFWFLKKCLKDGIEEGANANLVFRENCAYQSEEYAIEISDRITVSYADKLGIRNAVSSLLQLLTEKEGVFFAQKCSVHDYPDCHHRAIMIDLARGLPPMQRLQEDLLRFALVKGRFLHLHLMDSEGMCYLSDVFPLDTPLRGTARYRKEDLKDLVRYCDSLGLEIIPEIEFPSHASTLVQSFPELKCKTKLEHPSTMVVCAGNEQTYSFYEKLVDEIIEIFPSEYLHLGGDELFFEDFPDWNWHCHWSECAECRKRMEENGLETIPRLYDHAVNRMQKMLAKKGKKMILFNDQISADCETLSREIIIQFWRLLNEHRGPKNGCTIEDLLKKGFTVINSDFCNCYFDMEMYGNAEKLSHFRFDSLEACPQEAQKNLLGAEACFWEYGNPENKHYLFSFFYACALFADKLWDRSDVVYHSAYTKSLTKLIVGPCADGELDISALFGSVLPPRRNDLLSYASLKYETLKRKTYEQSMRKLKSIPQTYSPYFIDTLISEFEHYEEQQFQKAP